MTPAQAYQAALEAAAKFIQDHVLVWNYGSLKWEPAPGRNPGNNHGLEWAEGILDLPVPPELTAPAAPQDEPTLEELIEWHKNRHYSLNHTASSAAAKGEGSPQHETWAIYHAATARRLSEMLEPSDEMVERALRVWKGCSVLTSTDCMRAALKAAWRGI